MNAKSALVLSACGVSLFCSSCTLPSRGTLVDRSRVGRSMNVTTGDVVGVRDMVVSGDTGPIGTVGGGLVGHAAASGVGQGTGSLIAAAGGAVVGAIGGSAIEEAARRKEAQEIQVKLSNGDLVAVVQETKDGGPFVVGDHVQVLNGGAGMVVRRLY
jgi:outer membrane lipoprotein SlyB